MGLAGKNMTKAAVEKSYMFERAFQAVRENNDDKGYKWQRKMWSKAMNAGLVEERDAREIVPKANTQSLKVSQSTMKGELKRNERSSYAVTPKSFNFPLDAAPVLMPKISTIDLDG